MGIGGRAVRGARWASGLLLACSLAALGAASSSSAEPAEIPPAPPRLPTVAYVTETASTPAAVWAIKTDGTQAERLGPGTQPLVAPSGQQVAASLFGIGTGDEERGPAIAIYSTRDQPLLPGAPSTLQFLNQAVATASPLAWSRDLRYVAVLLQSSTLKNSEAHSGLAIIDLGTDSVRQIATGQVYGASFAPNGSDQIVYARAASMALKAPVNLFVSAPDGSGKRALTHDGHSLFPVWGNKGIAYDRERLRRNAAPMYQIWLRQPTGSRARRLTNTRVGPLVSGLVPLFFSHDGTRLLTEFEGQDTNEAFTLRVATGRTHRITVRGRPVIAAGISGDGATLLIDEGALGVPPSAGRVATIPFAGGPAKVIVAHGSDASWNG